MLSPLLRIAELYLLARFRLKLWACSTGANLLGNIQKFTSFPEAEIIIVWLFCQLFKDINKKLILWYWKPDSAILRVSPLIPSFFEDGKVGRCLLWHLWEKILLHWRGFLVCGNSCEFVFSKTEHSPKKAVPISYMKDVSIVGLLSYFFTGV